MEGLGSTFRIYSALSELLLWAMKHIHCWIVAVSHRNHQRDTVYDDGKQLYKRGGYMRIRGSLELWDRSVGLSVLLFDDERPDVVPGLLVVFGVGSVTVRELQ